MPDPITLCCTCLTCGGGQVVQFVPVDVKEILGRPLSYMIHCDDIELEIKKVRDEKARVQGLVETAKTNGKKIRENVEVWLDHVGRISDKYDGFQERFECKGKQISNNCYGGPSCEIGKMIYNIKKFLKESGEFGDKVSHEGDVFSARDMYSSIKDKSSLSRKKKVEEILVALERSSGKVITVYGVPGAGKTTLLKQLVQRAGHSKLFQVITEVINAETSDIKGIQKSIAKRIKLDLCDGDGHEIRADILNQQLSRLSKDKRILVVLDDGSTDIEKICNDVGIPFIAEESNQNNNNHLPQGSCTILMSCRKFDLPIDGNIHFRLDCIDKVKAQKLFRKTFRFKKDKPGEYTYVEDAVLKKCDGLPIAITELAHVSKNRWAARDEFVQQLRNRKWSDIAGLDKTSYRSIKRSYDMLELESIKILFLLITCLFRPGRSIVMEDVIRYGFGLDLFPTASERSPTEIADDWLKEIQSWSLLEANDDRGRIRINNVIQEVAISIASEGKYMLLVDVHGADVPGAGWTCTEKYTIISMNAKSSAEPESNQELLRADHYFKDSVEWPSELKALCLTKMKLSILPSLTALQTLSVEYCEIENASVISQSRFLIVLSFRGSKIANFPGDWQPGHLKSLDLTDCQLGGVVGDLIANSSHLWELHMHGCISDQDTTVEMVTESLVDRLRTLKHLSSLAIEIPSTCLPNVGDLLPCQQLESFKIDIGCTVPSPFEEFCLYKRVLLIEEIDQQRLESVRKLLQKTECLRLVKITGLKMVDFSSALVHLKCLHVRECAEIECIVSTRGSTAECLPELEILHLDTLNELDAICPREDPRNWGSKLRELKLLHLKKLKLPFIRIDDACKLATVEITDCERLEHIFSTTNSTPEITETSETTQVTEVPEITQVPEITETSETTQVTEVPEITQVPEIGEAPEITETGEVYDLPCLKKLKLEGLPMFKGLLAGDEVQFFNEKINFPALQELYLSRLGKIQKLWELSAGDPASVKPRFPESLGFRILKTKKIIKCEHLKSLCPPTVASALVELESLEITSCDSLKEVVKAETNANNAIKFPSLRRVKLDNLSSLQCFIQGSHTIEFPSLGTLILSSLPIMSTFIKSPENSGSPTNAGAQEGRSSVPNQVLFVKEVKFPSLEHLEICDMKHIEKLVEDGRETFPKLKSLSIEKICFEFIPQINLGILEQLEVRDCGSVIQYLPWTSLQNLRSLVIHGDIGMTSMLSSTDIVQKNVLPLLEDINIEKCEDLTEIVSEECKNAALLRYGASVFPRLKHIKLRGLKNLMTFTSGSYETNFPALKKVEVHTCPRFERFSVGRLRTPELEYVQVDPEPSTQGVIDLNDFIHNAFERRDEAMEEHGMPDDGNPGPSQSVSGVEASLQSLATHEPPEQVNTSERIEESEEAFELRDEAMEQHGSPDEGDPRPSQSVSGDDEYSQSSASSEESEPAMGQQGNEGDSEPTIAAAEDEATIDIVRMAIVIDRKGKGKLVDKEDKVDVISGALKTEEPLNHTARNTSEQIQLMNRNENTENPRPSGLMPGQVTNTERRVEEHDYDPTERNTDEQNLLMNYVNSCVTENNQSLFIYGNCVLVRDDLITFQKGGHLSVNIINVWAILLNKKHKSIDSPSRLIVTATCPLDKGVQKDLCIHETPIQIFAEQLDLLIEESVYTTIHKIDMVLFPIFASAHFYILSFSRKKENLIEIIDNSNAGDDDIDGKYGDVYENLRRLFGQYVTDKGQCDWAKEIANACPKVVKMDWRSDKNKHDCGIYAMRHMETYTGQEANEWDCGFNKGESTDVIISLRTKYNHAIITSNLNEIHLDLTEVKHSVEDRFRKKP